VSDIAQHIAVSHKVDFEDLDWKTARKVGLTRKEIESLAYFADIESRTVYYFLPGLHGLDCCTRWAEKVQPMLPPETRASSVPLGLSAAA
jgi:hypothetical protein